MLKRITSILICLLGVQGCLVKSFHSDRTMKPYQSPKKTFLLEWDAPKDTVTQFVIRSGSSEENVSAFVKTISLPTDGFDLAHPSTKVEVDPGNAQHACFTITAINNTAVSTPSSPFCVDLSK